MTKKNERERISPARGQTNKKVKKGDLSVTQQNPTWVQNNVWLIHASKCGGRIECLYEILTIPVLNASSTLKQKNKTSSFK